jgi:hypothetical protein
MQHTLTFKEAVRIVKHKGPVNLPTVMQKVHKAWSIVKPYLTDYEAMMVRHEMAPFLCGPRSGCHRSGFDIEWSFVEERWRKIGLDFE